MINIRSYLSGMAVDLCHLENNSLIDHEYCQFFFLCCSVMADMS
jgi:hypothetical protein